MILNAFKSKSRRFTAPFALFCVLLLLLSTVSTYAVWADTDTENETEAMLSDIIAFASGATDGDIDQWINGSLSGDPQMNEWYAIGLSKLMPKAELSPYCAALEGYLENNTVYSATTRQKYGLALIACGKGDGKYLSGLVDETAGKQGIMSYVFALHLLTNGADSEKYTPENIIPVLLKLACEGGGWSLTGKTADVDVTAMTVQALAPYYHAYSEVEVAVDAAILRLSAMQAEDGGFSTYGEANPESAAQVMIALTSLGRDPLTDGAFIKNGKSPLDAIKEYRLPDGGYSHRKGDSYNLAATSQVFLALSALTCFHTEETENAPFFLFGNAPAEFPTLDSSVADALSDKGGASDSGNGGNNGGQNAPNDGEDTVNDGKKKQGAYKLPVCIGIVIAAIAVCAVMFIKKKRAISDYLLVAVAAIALCLVVVFVDISTPEDYYGQTVTKDDPIGTVTVEIVCDTDLTGRDDAVILGKIALEIEEGETVYDLLTQACRAGGIVLDAMSGSPTGGVYIRGIDGLHEFDYGDLSGWTYTVNGQEIGIGSDKYTLSDGDVIVWRYSDTLGG